MKRTEETVTIGRKRLTLSNLGKIYWPKERYTKGDLIEYYRSVAKYILPYLRNRPESLNRHPNGISGPSFYQKDVGDMPPDWIRTEAVRSDSNDKTIRYLVVQDEASLVYVANLGCIEINPWFSSLGSLDRPDYLAIDLDPLDISFDHVVECARAVKEVLDSAGATGFCKTSGATGIHIYVPLKARYDYEIAREFAHVIAQLTHELLPSTTSIERTPAKRRRKIYVDFLQNRRGQTLAAPYSVRPRPMATVSAPLKWSEVKKGLSPGDFTIRNMPKRLQRTHGDIFRGVLEKSVDIRKCLKNLGA